MKKKAKQYLAGLLAAVTVFGTVFPSAAYAQEPAVEASADADFHILTPEMEWHAEETERRVLYEESQTGDSGGPGTVSGGNAGGSNTVSGGDAGGFRNADTVSGGDLPQDHSPAVVPEREAPEPHRAAAVPEGDASGTEETGTGYILSLTQNSEISTISDVGTVNVVRDITYPSELGGSYHTHYFTLNGVVAYCLEPNKSTPSNGDGGDVSMMYHPDVTKALYYGYGSDVTELTAFLEARELEASADRMYVYTHIAVSYYYNGGNASIAFYGIPNYIATPAYEWVNYITTLDDPIYSDGTASYVYPNPVYMKLGFLENVDYWTSETPYTGKTEHYDRDWAWISSDAIHITGSAYLAHNTTLTYNTFNARPWHTGAYSSDDMVSRENGFSGNAAYQVLHARKIGTDQPWYGGNVLVVEGGIVNKSYALRYCTFEGNVQDIGQVAQIELSSSSSSDTLVANITPLQLQFSKTDSRTGGPLEGAVYTLYYDADCEREILSAGTDAAGNGIFAFDKTAEIELLNTARDNDFVIYLKETAAPRGYLLDDTVRAIDLSAMEYSVKVLNGGYWGCASLGVFSDEQRLVELTIDIVKRGEALIGADVSETGVTFRYGTVELPLTAVFHVYAAETIEDGSGNVVYENGSLVAAVSTDETGHARLMELPLGRYRIVEAAAPEGYELDSSPRYVEASYEDISADESNAGVVIREVSFEDRRKRTTVQVRKLGDQGERGIGGAVIGLYAAEDIRDIYGNVLVKQDQLIEVVTTAKGGATVPEGSAVFQADLPVTADYYLREIQAPAGYVKSGARFEVNPGMGARSVIEILMRNTSQRASLTIYKEGEVLTGWNGRQFVYEQKRLPGFAFQVTAGEDIYRADGTLAYRQGDVVADRLVTGEEGSVSLTESLVTLGNSAPQMEQLHLGTYVIRETGTRDGYTLQQEGVTVRIEYAGQETECAFASETVRNVRQRAEVSVIKLDSDTEIPLQGGEFTLYADTDIRNVYGEVIVSAGTALGTMVTGADGRAVGAVDLPMGYSYHVAETRAPEGYLLDEDNTFAFDFADLEDTVEKTTFSHTFYNDRVRAQIQLQKLDLEIGEAVPQGDGTLAGAVYGLYAAEDIWHPDGHTGVLHPMGALVAELTTDAQGFARVENLYLGRYYVAEIAPSEGYVLDTDEDGAPRRYEVDCTYEGDRTTVVRRAVTSVEQVMKQPFQLIKLAVTEGQAENQLLEGAGFSAYLLSSLERLADGSYDYDSVEPVALCEDGSTILYTDENGYALSIPLPYGTYLVREVVVPENLKAVAPFVVTIDRHMPDTPQQWRVLLDERFTAKLQIVKKDAVTGRNILRAGAGFRIYDLDAEEYVSQYVTYPSREILSTFYTDETGSLILPNALPAGHYRMEEVSAPFGYIINPEHVTITVASDAVYRQDPDTGELIVTVTCEDIPVTGDLSVFKQGPVLEDFVYTAGTEETGETAEFRYVEAGIPGVVFQVSAAEDIYTPDGQINADGSRCRIYTSGEVVGTIVTGEDGIGALTGLPLGTYRIVETEAPEGFVLDGEAQYVTLTYEGDRTPLVFAGSSFWNERQRAELKLIKQDGETEEALAGAVYGLYAAEEIRNVRGELLVESGGYIVSAVSDESGEIRFDCELPLSSYEVRELAAPTGYVSDDTVYIYHLRAQAGMTVSCSQVFPNYPTRVEITKSDLTTGVELSGAMLTVADSEGQVVDSWTSVAGRAHVIKGLHVGETYTLTEVLAPYGYLQAESICFTIEDTAEVQHVQMQDTVPVGKLIINKQGEFLEKISLSDRVAEWIRHLFSYGTGGLSGVTFRVYAAEDIKAADQTSGNYYSAGELVATITTDDTGIAVLDNLPLGIYCVREAGTAAGYQIDEEERIIELTYRDQNTPVVTYREDWNNLRTRMIVHITKLGADTQEALEGAVFGLYCAEDIWSKSGELLFTADELIESGMTDAEGGYTFTADLPYGYEYYVKELEAPEGYLVDIIPRFFTLPKGAVLEMEFVFEDQPIEKMWTQLIVHITKLGADTQEALEGAVFGLYCAEDIWSESEELLFAADELIESGITDAEGGYTFTADLPYGYEYYVKELEAPEGYFVDRIPRYFTLPEGEVLEIEFVFEDLPLEKMPPRQSVRKNTPDKPTETILEPEELLTEDELLTEELPDWNNPRTDDSGAPGYSILLQLTEDDGGGTQGGAFLAVLCSLSAIMLAGAAFGATKRHGPKGKREK